MKTRKSQNMTKHNHEFIQLFIKKNRKHEQKLDPGQPIESRPLGWRRLSLCGSIPLCGWLWVALCFMPLPVDFQLWSSSVWNKYSFRRPQLPIERMCFFSHFSFLGLLGGMSLSFCTLLWLVDLCRSFFRLGSKADLAVQQKVGQVGGQAPGQTPWSQMWRNLSLVRKHSQNQQNIDKTGLVKSTSRWIESCCLTVYMSNAYVLFMINVVYIVYYSPICRAWSAIWYMAVASCAIHPAHWLFQSG